MKLHFTRLIICCFTLLLCTANPPSLWAQYDNIWIFGGDVDTDSLGLKLDFNNSIPTLSPVRFPGLGEAAASVCDAKGQLLFYTEGDTIWNRNGLPMPNGGGLTGIPQPLPGYSPTASSVQGALIVPMPGNPEKYYVLSLTDRITYFTMGIQGFLYYSVVDMTLNGGLGDVVAGQKGIFVDSNLTECVVGVSGNSCNIWVVAPAYSATTYKTDLFNVYEITENGFNSVPKVFDVGYGVSTFDLYGDICTISFSPDRKKLARARRTSIEPNHLELYDFDPATGRIFNRLNIDSASGYTYSNICFSPDNSKLYVATYNNEPIKTKLYQFDLSSPNVMAINNSKILLKDTITITGLKQGPDNKIYYFSDETTLSRINYPNEKGLSCQPGKAPSADFSPVSSRMFSNTVPIPIPDSAFTIHNKTCSAMSLRPADTSSLWYQWDDNSTNKEREVSTVGTYWVRHGDYCHYKIDSFFINNNIAAPIISIDTFTLRTTIAYFTYQWLFNGQVIPGATNSSYTVTQNGDYSVVVSNKEGCIDTSDAYPVNNVDIGAITSSVKSIRIYPNPAKDDIYIEAPTPINGQIFSIEGRQIKTFGEDKHVSLRDITNGIYLLYIHDTNGRLLKMEKVVKAGQ